MRPLASLALIAGSTLAALSAGLLLGLALYMGLGGAAGPHRSRRRARCPAEPDVRSHP